MNSLEKEICLIIKDPIHGTIQFNSKEANWVKYIINTKYFQRLRYIKQLGLTSLIFHGAEHNRFSHSIGCSYISKLISEKLFLNKDEKKYVIISTLLHDIGHGPFSHLFEHLFEKKSITHEMWVENFLLDIFKNNNNVIGGLSLERNDIHIISSLIQNKFSPGIIQDIVSSKLDADRLDYLLRDSHYCGVAYGFFDLPWLITCLTSIYDKANKCKRLGVIKKGSGIIEQYLISRKLMINNIYQNLKKSAIELYLIKYLKLISEKIANKIDIKNDNFYKNIFNFMENLFNYNQIIKKISNKKKIKQTAEVFINENYKYYKNITDMDIFLILKNTQLFENDISIKKLGDCIFNRKLPKVWPIKLENIDAVKNFISDNKSILYSKKYYEWQFCTGSINSVEKKIEERKSTILMLNRDNTIQKINQISPILNVLSDSSYNNFFYLSVDRNILEDKCIKKIINHLNKKNLLN